MEAWELHMEENSYDHVPDPGLDNLVLNISFQCQLNPGGFNAVETGFMVRIPRVV